jgi:cytochrome c oxidase subunit IV
MSEHIVPTRTYYVVYLILMMCTALTVWVAYFDLGPLNTVAALAIALFKAVLVVLIFMHVKYSSRLIWVVIAGGLFWLLLLFTIASDYLTRAWQPFGSV